MRQLSGVRTPSSFGKYAHNRPTTTRIYEFQHAKPALPLSNCKVAIHGPMHHNSSDWLTTQNHSLPLYTCKKAINAPSCVWSTTYPLDSIRGACPGAFDCQSQPTLTSPQLLCSPLPLLLSIFDTRTHSHTYTYTSHSCQDNDSRSEDRP